MPHICPRCHTLDVIIYQCYPRAADEPISEFLWCNYCGYVIRLTKN